MKMKVLHCYLLGREDAMVDSNEKWLEVPMKHWDESWSPEQKAAYDKAYDEYTNPDFSLE